LQKRKTKTKQEVKWDTIIEMYILEPSIYIPFQYNIRHSFKLSI